MNKAILANRNLPLKPHNHDDLYYRKDELYIKIYDCDSSTSVGDLVYMSPTIDNFVHSATNHKNINPIIGIVLEKVTTVTARIQLFGECEINYPLLEKSKNVFLGIDGKPTNVVPSDGYIQNLGVCLEDGKVFLNIEYSRIKRNPF